MNDVKKDKTLLNVKDLKKYYAVEKGVFHKIVGYVKAVDKISFSINEGEVLGMVGESGCGKTTVGRCILRAIEPDSGEISYNFGNGKTVDITTQTKRELRKKRRYMQMVFQDPYSSLDPRKTVFDIVGEPIAASGDLRGRKMDEKVVYAIEQVGLEIRFMKRYPHAFSGGQRQRIAIARALASEPKFLVADEPVSALDLSVRAEILNLLSDLKEKNQLSYLFISHDLSVISYMSDRVAVMYVGKIVEMAKTDDIFGCPKHPYTEALLAANPIPDPRIKRNKIILQGEIPNPINPPSGCYFHPRCLYAENVCRVLHPELRTINNEHQVACHFAEKLQLQGIQV